MSRKLAVTFAGTRDGRAEVVDEDGRMHRVDADVLAAGGLRSIRTGQRLVAALQADRIVAVALPGGALG